MQIFFDWMDAFFASGSLWVYVLIFVGKIFQVTFATLRIVLVSRGEKLKGSLAAVIEMGIWLVLISNVLEGWKEDIFKGVAYVVAYGCGSYMGAWLDEFLAFGLSSVQIVAATSDEARQLSDYLRSRGHGVTTINVRGRTAEEHCMLILVIKRKNLKGLLNDIKHICPSAMVTVNDVKTVRGGYIRGSGKHRGRPVNYNSR